MNVQQLLNDNIFDLMGLQRLPEPKKAELLAKMSQVVQDRITDRMVESMSEDQRREFDRMAGENADAGAIDAYLRQAVPGMEQIVTEELARFKKEMVDESATVRQIAATV